MENLFDQNIHNTNDLFDDHFLNAKGLYLHRFNRLPNLSCIYHIDGEKSFNAIKGKFDKDIVEVYQPLEKKIREVASQILEARTTPDLIPELKEKLSAVLDELKQRAEAGNSRLIQEMTSKLRTATTRAVAPTAT